MGVPSSAHSADLRASASIRAAAAELADYATAATTTFTTESTESAENNHRGPGETISPRLPQKRSEL